MRVLLVEDDAFLGRGMEEAISNAGHQVLGPIPSTGMALMLARTERPTLAIIDLDLAHTQDGEQLTRTLRDMEIPSIVMSDQLEKIALAGDVAIGSMSKAIRPEDLPAALDAAARIIWQHLVLEGQRLEVPDGGLPSALSVFSQTDG